MIESAEVTEVLTSQLSPLLASALLALALILARWLLLRYWFYRIEGTSAQRRKARAVSRGILVALLVFGMAFVWAPELQAFALSIAAFAVALVISTKELILAALGGIYRLITRAYKVGDWVSIGSMRGEVVDFGLTSTTLERLGPGASGSNYTGQRIIVPNSKLLTESVVNEHEIGPFVMHSVSVPVQKSTDLAEAERVLREATLAAFDRESVAYKKFVKAMSQNLDCGPSSMGPNFTVHYTEPDKGALTVSLFLPTQDLSDREYAIVKSYMEWFKTTGPAVSQ